MKIIRNILAAAPDDTEECLPALIRLATAKIFSGASVTVGERLRRVFLREQTWRVLEQM
jgi:hypothetical protein